LIYSRIKIFCDVYSINIHTFFLISTLLVVVRVLKVISWSFIATLSVGAIAGLDCLGLTKELKFLLRKFPKASIVTLFVRFTWFMGKFFSSMFTFIIAKVVNMVFTPCSVIGLPAYQGYRMLEVL